MPLANFKGNAKPFTFANASEMGKRSAEAKKRYALEKLAQRQESQTTPIIARNSTQAAALTSAGPAAPLEPPCGLSLGQTLGPAPQAQTFNSTEQKAS